MRSFWMASAALFITGGVAFAQTNSMSSGDSSPVPTGAINAPVETQPGQSPGNTAPNPSSTTAMPAASADGTASPAPTGAINAPVETQPGQSPGNTAPNNMSPGNQSSSDMPSSGMSNSGSSSSGMANTNATQGASSGMMRSTHHWTHHEKMSENAGPRAYLHIAKHAIEHHDKKRAESALARAETRLLNRSVDAGSSMTTDQSPAVKAIENARKALSSGDYTTASQDTDIALHESKSANGMTNSNSSAAPNAVQ